MNIFVSKLFANKLVEARNELEEKINQLVEEKLNQVKLRVATEMFEDCGVEFVLDEGNKRSNVLKMGRTKMIRVRVRKGKIQRRKKFSAVKGYTIRNGKLTRMMPQERRHRKMGAKRSKLKRRSKLRTSLRKRKISLRKRRAMGL
jgi:hypothetical protein